MKRSAIVWTAIFKKYIRYIMVVSQCYRRVRILEYPGEIADRASRWRSLSYCRDGSLEKMVLQHFQYIGKSTVIWQSVSKFPFCFRYIQHIFLFILGIYWSFSVFFQKYVIKCFTRLNTISVFFSSNCSMLDPVTNRSFLLFWMRRFHNLGRQLKNSNCKTCMYMQFDRPHYHLYSIYNLRKELPFLAIFHLTQLFYLC